MRHPCTRASSSGASRTRKTRPAPGERRLTDDLIPSFRINRTVGGDYEEREGREALEVLKIFAFFAPFVVTLFLKDGMRGHFHFLMTETLCPLRLRVSAFDSHRRF